MLAQIITENGQKKAIPLTADAGAGNPVGTIIPMYKKSSPSGYLYCDGSTFDETKYPLLYAYLGSNVLPDYREFALVGAEQNTTSSNIATHDVYTEGQEKDDQLQEHKHGMYIGNTLFDQAPNSTASAGSGLRAFNNAGTSSAIRASNILEGRNGTVTRGKRKAVFFYIKATSGLSENAQDNVVAQLNEERSYSTSEVNTGKKWIDGKPIYSKVVEINSATASASSQSFPHGVTGLEKIITLYGNCVISNRERMFPYFDNENKCFVVYYDSANIVLFFGYSTTNLKLVIEYTKTTD